MMILLQFPEETLVRETVVPEELLAHLAAKGGDEISLEILANARFVLQPAGDLKSDSFHKLRSAGRIVQFPFDMPVCPRPKSFTHDDNTLVDWSTP